MGCRSKLRGNHSDKSEIRIPQPGRRTSRAEPSSRRVELWSRFRNLHGSKRRGNEKGLWRPVGLEPDNHCGLRLSEKESIGEEKEPGAAPASRVCRKVRQPGRREEAQQQSLDSLSEVQHEPPPQPPGPQ